MLNFLEFDNLNEIKKSLPQCLNENTEADFKKYEVLREARSRLERVLMIVTSHFPFYGRFVRDFRYVFTTSVPAAATDGKNMFFNPYWIVKKDIPDRMIYFVVIHEITHNTLDHIRRGLDKDVFRNKARREAWNYATDYVINQYLIDMGIGTEEMLKKHGGLLNKEYSYKPEEISFEKLLKNPPQSEKDSESESGKEQKLPRKGDIIKTNDGKYGKIIDIDDDEYIIEPITKDQAREELKKQNS